MPLRLVAVGGEDAASVDSPPDLQAALAAGQPFDGSGDAASAGGTGGSGALARLGRLLAQVVASLQQPLLADVGIRCAAPGGGQLLHRCREQAERQLGGWADGGGAACGAMQAMLSHVSQVEVRSLPRPAGLLQLLGCRAGGCGRGGRLQAGRSTHPQPPINPRLRRRRSGGWTRCWMPR